MSAFETFWAIYSNVVLSLGTNALLALSIWLTLDCGMLSIANAAFMGIGAYSAALLTVNFAPPFIVSLLAGMIVPPSTGPRRPLIPPRIVMVRISTARSNPYSLGPI
jgi:ABC-type branched-subunit amino acid transport system permease subunit